MKNKLSVLFFFVFFISGLLKAEDYKIRMVEDKSKVILDIALDKDKMAIEDLKAEAYGAPLRIAMLLSLPINMDSVGIWKTNENESQSWTFSISVPSSYGFIAYFNKFSIPKGAELYVYSEDKDSRTSVYDSDVNEGGGRYSTEIELGKEMIFEYVAPKGVKAKPTLELTQIGYKYKDLQEAYYTKDSYLRALNEPENSCIPNINCVEGADWQIEKKGVVRLRTVMGRYVYSCSGSLVNNTQEDRTPYILSAYHCFFTESGDKLDVDATEFIFEYEHPACQNIITRPQGKLLTGAEVLVLSPIHGGSDGALLKLYQRIPDTWDVQFNGWTTLDKSNVHTNGSVIHHPIGDVKKISLYNKPLITTSWNNVEGTSMINAHWNVNYNIGVTQRGSSGAPLFNQNWLIVGTLTGGNTNCDSKENGSDQYGKFSYHWDKYYDPKQHMKQYLDPFNELKPDIEGAVSLAGFPYKHDNPDPGTDKNTPSVFLRKSGYDVELISQEENIQSIRIVSLQGIVLYDKKNINALYHQISILPMSRGVHLLTAYTADGKRHRMKYIR